MNEITISDTSQTFKFQNMRKNFTMDSNLRQEEYKSKKEFRKSRLTNYTIILGILVCCLIAGVLLVYKYAQCSQDIETSLSSPFDVMRNSSTTNIIKDVRLPRSIKPVSYDIQLLPFLIDDNFTFNGEVSIKMFMLENCKNITLHSMSLKILQNHTTVEKIKEKSNDIETLPVINHFFINEKQFLIIEVDGELEKDSYYILKLKYIGTLRDDLQGFYRYA